MHSFCGCLEKHTYMMLYRRAWCSCRKDDLDYILAYRCQHLLPPHHLRNIPTFDVCMLHTIEARDFACAQLGTVGPAGTGLRSKKSLRVVSAAWSYWCRSRDIKTEKTDLILTPSKSDDEISRVVAVGKAGILDSPDSLVRLVASACTAEQSVEKVGKRAILRSRPGAVLNLSELTLSPGAKVCDSQV
jgi:hypothetical protein